MTLLDRWKILDNLRRSLVPATSLGAQIASWLISPPVGVMATLVVGAQLLSRPLVQPFTMATTRRGWRGFSWRKATHDLVRAAADAALLPHQAWAALDAITRVGYRRLVSQRGLLQWKAQAAYRSSSRQQRLLKRPLGGMNCAPTGSAHGVGARFIAPTQA